MAPSIPYKVVVYLTTLPTLRAYNSLYMQDYFKQFFLFSFRIKMSMVKAKGTVFYKRNCTMVNSLAHKSNFAGHVIVTTGLQRMHFPHPGFFLRWNSNLQQVDFSQGFASDNILGLVVLAVNDGFLHLHVWSVHFSVYIFAIWKFKYNNHTFLRYPS